MFNFSSECQSIFQMDKLEKFIQENREAFDGEHPSLKVWAQVEKQLGAPEKPAPIVRRPWKRLQIAAAVALLLLVGAFGGSRYAHYQYQKQLAAALPLEFKDAADYYERQIEQGMAQLTALGADTHDVRNDLRQLEVSFEQLKKEMANSPNMANEAFINAMIANYRIRIDILERVLERVKDVKENNIEINSKHNKNEKSI